MADFSYLFKCDECGQRMAERYGRFGRFLACYIEAHKTKPLPLYLHCPSCHQAPLFERFWNGQSHAVCKVCSYSSPAIINDRDCPSCLTSFLVTRPTGCYCMREGCGYVESW